MLVGDQGEEVDEGVGERGPLEELAREVGAALLLEPLGLPSRAWMLVTFGPAGMKSFFETLSRLTAFDLDTFQRPAAEGVESSGPPLFESDRF